jgi:orotate phosphoribosyltransferase
VIGVVREHGAQVAGVAVIVMRGDADFGVPNARATGSAARVARSCAIVRNVRPVTPIDDPGSRRN